MQRREFIASLAGAAALPLAARAQQPGRMRRIGVLVPGASDDALFQAYVGAFLQGLALSGWTIGRNVRIDTRWATPNAAEIRSHAAELAALAPDVIMAQGTSTVAPLLQATRTVGYMPKSNYCKKPTINCCKSLTVMSKLETTSICVKTHIGILEEPQRLSQKKGNLFLVKRGGEIGKGKREIWVKRGLFDMEKTEALK